MGNVFKNQGYFVLELDTDTDLTSANKPRIYYKKPNGLTGYYIAEIIGTKLRYQFNNGDLDVAGLWQFQSYFSIGEKDAFGDIVQQRIKKTII